MRTWESLHNESSTPPFSLLKGLISASLRPIWVGEDITLCVIKIECGIKRCGRQKDNLCLFCNFLCLCQLFLILQKIRNISILLPLYSLYILVNEI